VDGVSQEGTARARRAFDHAVKREREAIATHERAAIMHERAAALLEQAALTEHDPTRVDELTQRAQFERERTAAANRRADVARDRLRSEGVPLDD
jgi:hypothetical protein